MALCTSREVRDDSHRAEGNAMPDNIILPYLRIGSGGPLVRSLQNQLRRDGISLNGVEGIFGRQTEQALRKFQESREIEPDGIVGPDTWRALAKAGLDLASL